MRMRMTMTMRRKRRVMTSNEYKEPNRIRYIKRPATNGNTAAINHQLPGFFKRPVAACGGLGKGLGDG